MSSSSSCSVLSVLPVCLPECVSAWCTSGSWLDNMAPTNACEGHHWSRGALSFWDMPVGCLATRREYMICQSLSIAQADDTMLYL